MPQPKLVKRGKGRYTADKSLKDSYLYYKSKFKKIEELTKFSETSVKNKALSWLEYKEIAIDTLTEVMSRILNSSETLQLPYNLGIIRVIKKPMNIGYLNEQNNLKPDWGHYQKTGKIIKHLNEHRDNCRYGFYWLCKKGPKGKNMYKFQALRTHRRQLAQLLKTTNIDYYN